MTIHARLIKLLGDKHAAKVWEKIKYWRQEQQFDYVVGLKEKMKTKKIEYEKRNS